MQLGLLFLNFIIFSISMILSIFINFIKVIYLSLHFLITGGEFGSAINSGSSKWQEQRSRDFLKFGGHECYICGTRTLSINKYCLSCYLSYKK
jgi:hypothetical protein